jgi:hypothetical protein
MEVKCISISRVLQFVPGLIRGAIVNVAGNSARYCLLEEFSRSGHPIRHTLRPPTWIPRSSPVLSSARTEGVPTFSSSATCSIVRKRCDGTTFEFNPAVGGGLAGGVAVTVTADVSATT